MNEQVNPAQTLLLKLFQIEKELRAAGKTNELFYVLLNRMRSLFDFDTAVLFSCDQGKTRVVMISDVADVDRNAPYAVWMQQVGANCLKSEDALRPHIFNLSDRLAGIDGEDAREWGASHNAWFPLVSAKGGYIGALWLMRATAFDENELAVAEKLCDVSGHAWWALAPKKNWSLRQLKNRKFLIVLGLVALLAQFIPVSQSALAPGEVIAYKPALISAPMNGVIKEVLVQPNSEVSEGQILARLDETELKGRLDIAEEELLVAQSELLSTQQGAFLDPRLKGEITVLQSKLALRQAQRDFARSQIEKIDIRAPRKGVVVFRDVADLEGVPVKTGERLMQVADAYDTQLCIELPVEEAISFEKGANIRFFLDKAPLSPLKATLQHSSFDAAPTPSGVLSYRLTAGFDDTDKPRLGLRGSAKIEGETVMLFQYLFRRPLAKMRQYLGF